MRLTSLIFNFTLFVAYLTAETNYALQGNENLQKLNKKTLSQNPNSGGSIRKKMVQAQWISKGKNC